MIHIICTAVHYIAQYMSIRDTKNTYHLSYNKYYYLYTVIQHIVNFLFCHTHALHIVMYLVIPYIKYHILHNTCQPYPTSYNVFSNYLTTHIICTAVPYITLSAIPYNTYHLSCPWLVIPYITY